MICEPIEESSARWVDLVRKIASGDEPGVALLYPILHDVVRMQLMHTVRPQFMDDAIQEVLLIVLETIRNAELREPERLMGFVKTVAQRRAVAHIRWSMIRRRFVTSNSPEPRAPLRDSADHLVAQEERTQNVRKLLRCLRPRDRELMERFYLFDQSRETICREMGLTYTQFRLFKSRAISRCSTLGTTPAALNRPVRIESRIA